MHRIRHWNQEILKTKTASQTAILPQQHNRETQVLNIKVTKRT